jgi:predicted nucleic acid-binding protein
MPAKVVDASALGALIFGEPESREVAAQLGQDLLLAPQLLRFEVANICWKKLRRHPDQRAALLAAHEMLDRMEIQEIAVPLHLVLLLAEKERLTAYDASYLWLARELGVELVTLDHDLKKRIGADLPGN